ncbi:MAG: YjbH domain-containing protein [Prevotella sp.]|jgi:hypothetical protein|nr:YjbH domain-containing protein [Prevotella sp.]
MIKRIILYCLFIGCRLVLSAQLTYGVTGLLHAPSAEMQADKTVMLGGTFLNKEITPAPWKNNYHTYNYFLNVTFFPWLEVAYTCTLFQSQTVGITWKVEAGKFTNQDRYFSARIQVLKENQFWEYMPAVVIGTSDPYTSTGNGRIAPVGGNGYWSRFYVALSKFLPIAKENVGIHASYLYNERKQYPLNGLAAGITCSLSFLPDLRIIAEYDTKDFAAGFIYLLFKHLHMQVELQRMKYFTGGLAYKIYLKQ